MNQTDTENRSPWVKTPAANLVRYKPSGVYFARAKVGGKLIRRTLKTNVLSIARLRLRDLLAGEQQNLHRQNTIAVGKMTFGDALEIYQRRMEKDAELKPSSKKYQNEILKALHKSWPELSGLDIKRITKNQCLDWRSNFGAAYSATRVNGAVSLLRRTFEIAIDAGVRYDNPAQSVRRARVKQKEFALPETEQFLRFTAELENGGGRDSKNCATFVRFMAFGGFRLAEAGNITWADCDFTRNKIAVRGDPETGTKNSEIREVPMIPDMRDLLDELRGDRPNEPLETPVMRVRECQKAMDRAARIIGMARITHHDLRHLFATRCIESGVDIPTVSSRALKNRAIFAASS